MAEFGEKLRRFRQQCNDTKSPHGKLTQQRLGEVVGEELGISYSGAAVSDWERGITRIHADDRIVLICLVKVLHKYEGLKSLIEANELLESGNYRALNADEIKIIFPESIIDTPPQEPSSPHEKAENRQGIIDIVGKFFSEASQEFQAIVVKAKEGPSPYWPRVIVAIYRRFTDHLSVSSALTFVLWIWVWLSAWVLITPSLRWPFSSPHQVLLAVVAYAVGSMIIPALIGALTNTKDSKFWQEQQPVRELTLRLYTHQGASIGFHVGYFFIFMIGLLRYNLGLQSVIWIELTAAAFLIILAYASGRLIPYNLLLAYKQLSLRDGAIFFVFFLFGPAWGYFLLKSYDILLTRTLGVFTILLAITILLAMMTLRYRQTRTTVIPVSWWVIFFGSIMLCQFLALLIK